jgi:hypothetical protein
MKLKKELRAVKEINEQERKKREDGRSDGESAIFYLWSTHKINNKKSDNKVSSINYLALLFSKQIFLPLFAKSQLAFSAPFTQNFASVVIFSQLVKRKNLVQ